jgi:hypothetical protein
MRELQRDYWNSISCANEQNTPKIELPKPKEKTKISAGTRVQLKNDKSTDGKILGSIWKAKWSTERT